MLAVTIPFTIFLLIIYCYWVWNKCSSAFPFTIIFLIEIIWGTLSIVWIDNGVYITEQLRESYTTGAAIRYIILMAPFAYIFPKHLNKRINKSKSSQIYFKMTGISIDDVMWYSCVIVALYLFLDLVITGTPLLSSAITKRRYYSEYSKLPFTDTLHQMILPFTMLFCGIRFVKYSRDKIKKYISIVIACLIILIQLLLDNKFYGLYDYAIWFVIPIFGDYLKKLSIMKKKKLPLKYIIIALVIVGILLAICYSQYARQYTNPLTALLNRVFSLQSHTFWGIDLKLQDGELSFDFQTLTDEIFAGIQGVSNTNPDYGIAKAMYYVTRNTFANDFLSTGTLFAGSFITVAMSYSGYILTFIWSATFGYLAAYICTILMEYLRLDDYLMIYFVFILYRRLYEYFRVGSLSILLSWKMLLLFAFIVLMVNFCHIKAKSVISK